MGELTRRLLKDDPGFRRSYDENAEKRSLALAMRALRRKAGLTQTDLMAASGLPQSHISKIEKPTGPMPSLETIRRYAHACGMAPRLSFVALEEVEAQKEADRQHVSALEAAQDRPRIDLDTTRRKTARKVPRKSAAPAEPASGPAPDHPDRSVAYAYV